ncbi:LicD family protein [Dehalococcoidia bacterium]|nr:LicD family protein [Dehalococcoidia bacterium]
MGNDLAMVRKQRDAFIMKSSDSTNAEIQNKLTRTTPPMDVAIAEKLLLEVKEIMDRLGVQFFLRQGTCLGAIRNNAFIPWDDDLDLGVILGVNGLTEQSIEPLMAVFRESGYYVRSEPSDHMVYTSLLKDNIRVDVTFLRVIDEQIYHWPGVWFPVTLFNQLKEINFIGETFLVPNPPEEYLRIKYGPDWQTPKRFGYAKDVVDNVPREHTPGFLQRMKRSISGFFYPGNITRLRVLDNNESPVDRANIRIVGLESFKTNSQGYAKLYLKTKRYSSSLPSGISDEMGAVCSIVVSYGDHEEVLYEEILAPNRSYVYKPDPAQTEGRIFVLSRL